MAPPRHPRLRPPPMSPTSTPPRRAEAVAHLRRLQLRPLPPTTVREGRRLRTAVEVGSDTRLSRPGARTRCRLRGAPLGGASVVSVLPHLGPQTRHRPRRAPPGGAPASTSLADLGVAIPPEQASPIRWLAWASCCRSPWSCSACSATSSTATTSTTSRRPVPHSSSRGKNV